jgi:hypothetical protein
MFVIALYAVPAALGFLAFGMSTEGDTALVLTPDQRLLATEAGGEPTSAVVTLWSVGRPGLRRLSSFEGGVTVAIAPDGRLVATSALGGRPRCGA